MLLVLLLTLLFPLTGARFALRHGHLMHALTATKGCMIGLKLPGNEAEFKVIRDLTSQDHDNCLCSDHVVDPSKIVAIRRKAESDGHQINESVFFSYLQAAQNSRVEFKSHHRTGLAKKKHTGRIYKLSLQRLTETIKSL